MTILVKFAVKLARFQAVQAKLKAKDEARRVAHKKKMWRLSLKRWRRRKERLERQELKFVMREARKLLKEEVNHE